MTIEPPKEPSDAVLAAESLARGGISAVPLLGGLLVELFTGATTAGRLARQQKWMEDISEAVNRLVLEPRGLTMEDLATDDGFLNVIGAASRAAVETSDQVKLEALRNAVLNSTLGPDTEADRRAILMDIVVSLTPTHIKLLELFREPSEWLERAGKPGPPANSGAPIELVRVAFPEMLESPSLLTHVVKDLEAKSLTTKISLMTTMTWEGIMASHVAPLGNELFAFISAHTEPQVQ